MIEIRDVKKSYQLGQTQVHALRGISLDIHQGEFTTLIGTSGSGKSTLLNLVGCIDEPDQGKILIEGQDVSMLSEKEKARLRNQKIGFVFQAFNLIPVLSVFENVELPLVLKNTKNPNERRETVMSILHDVGLQDQIHSMPDKLSGGQRQRVAIARALVGNPLIVIADEPTANLDSGTTHKIIDLLLEMNSKRGVTFLFSTHDEKLISRVSRVLRIQDGQIVQ